MKQRANVLSWHRENLEYNQMLSQIHCIMIHTDLTYWWYLLHGYY